MKALELRPMGVGDILDTAFRLYRARFGTFILIVMLAYIPFGLANAIFLNSLGIQQQNPLAPLFNRSSENRSEQRPTTALTIQAPPSVGQFDPDAPFTPPDPMVAIGGGIGFLLFAVVVLPLCQGALIHTISAAYLGEELSAAQSYGRAAPKLLRLILASIMAGIVMMFGVCLFVVGFVIFLLWFMLVSPVILLEDLGASGSLGRSRELMRGNLGKGFLLLLVVGLLALAIQLGVWSVLALIPMPHPIVSAFLEAVVPGFIVPLQLAPSILLYYDIRIRKEGFDLERLASALGRPAIAS